MRAAVSGVACLLMGLVTGCSAMGPNCSLTGVSYTVSPATATADHAASTPGNQQQFSIFGAPTAPVGCAVPTNIAKVSGAWTSADPANVSISSANDATNGLATCLGATAGPVSLIATYASTQKSTVTLTCK